MLLTINTAGCDKVMRGPARLDGARGTIPVLAPSSEASERSSAFTSDDIDSPTRFNTYIWHGENGKSRIDLTEDVFSERQR